MTLPRPVDEVLASRMAQGDVAAFEALYDRYSDRVHAWASHSLGARHADDALQEVFLRVWRHAVQFDRARGPFSAWLTAIARHYFIGELRRQGRRAQVAAAGNVEDVLAARSDPGPGVEDLVAQGEQADLLLKALGTLPADQRRIIVLGYFGGLTQPEMAEQLGIPIGTVKTRVRLAMQKLRSALVADGSRSDLNQPRLRVVGDVVRASDD